MLFVLCLGVALAGDTFLLAALLSLFYLVGHILLRKKPNIGFWKNIEICFLIASSFIGILMILSQYWWKNTSSIPSNQIF